MIVEEIGVFLKSLEALLPHCLLQFADGQRIQQMILAIDSLMVSSAYRQIRLRLGQWSERVLVLSCAFALALRAQCLPAARLYRQNKNSLILVQAYGLEDLRPLIAL